MSLLDPFRLTSGAPATRLPQVDYSLAVREHRRACAAKGGCSHACHHFRDRERGLARRARRVKHRGAASGFRAHAEPCVLLTAQGSNARHQRAAERQWLDHVSCAAAAPLHVLVRRAPAFLQSASPSFLRARPFNPSSSPLFLWPPPDKETGSLFKPLPAHSFIWPPPDKQTSG